METDPYVDDLIKRVKPMGVVESRIHLLQRYQQRFGFPELEDEGTVLPIPEMAAWRIEDVNSGSLALELPRMFHYYQINKYFHIGLDTFMDYPEYYCKQLCELASSFATQEIREREDAEREAVRRAKAESKPSPGGLNISKQAQAKLDQFSLVGV